MPEMKGGRFFLLLLNMNQAVVDVLGEDDIVEAQPDIVAEETFFPLFFRPEPELFPQIDGSAQNAGNF